MDPETVVAICSAVVAVAAAVVSAMQARFAKQQVKIGERQAEQAEIEFRTHQKAAASTAVQELSHALAVAFRYMSDVRHLSIDDYTESEWVERRRVMKELHDAYEGTSMRRTSFPPGIWKIVTDGFMDAITGLQNIGEPDTDYETRQRSLIQNRVSLMNALKDWWRMPA